MNILIADDSDTSRKLLRAVLEVEGHSVIAAADGDEAMALLERHPIDAIFSDLLMPNLDGYRLCRQIRQDRRWNRIPFICFTAIYGSQNDEKLAFELGADAYLRKPCSGGTILSTLHAALKGIGSRVRKPNQKHSELDVLNAYSQHMVMELQNKNLELTEKSQLAELAVEVGIALTRRKTLAEILRACSESMVKHLDAALARIWIFCEKERALDLRASSPEGALPKNNRLDEALVSRIGQERKAYQTDVIQDELQSEERDWAQRECVVAFAGYPLIVEERLVGVMAVFFRKQLHEATISTLAAIADSVALCIQAKQAEEILRESEERFRQMAENISEVFWLTDPTGREIFYVSPAFESILGRTCKSLQEHPESFFDAIYAEDRPRVLDALRSQRATPYELQYRIVRPEGAIRWIRARTFPIRDSAGAVIRLVGVMEDVTEKSQLEMQMHQSQKMLALGRLAGGIAHDFNNELLIIFGHSELLVADSPSQEQLRESLGEIHESAKRAAGLTSQLLSFSRRQVIEPKVLELNTILADSQRLLGRLIGEDIRMKMVFSPGLSRVNVDPGQIGQVLMNLALNARDAMPTGGELTFETSEVELEPTYANEHLELGTGRHVLLSVRDNGCGISPEEQEHIFEPFFTTKPAGQGTGLGLSVVEGIVKQSKGHIFVDSVQGKGTTFKIYLPAIDEAETISSQSDLSKPVGGHETILLVEDEDPVREVSASLLKFLGYKVLQAPDAEKALHLARKKSRKIDMLLTDVIMPVVSGRKLAEAILSEKPGIKVLFQSGHTDDMVARHGILHAEVAFLQKPFTIHALAKKVRAVLDQKQGFPVKKWTLNSWCTSAWNRLNQPLFIEQASSSRLKKT